MVFATFTLIALILSTLSFGSESNYPITVDLNQSEYLDGVISTQSGGVIRSPKIRIQARYITYTYKVENGKVIHSVVAKGDLLLNKDGQTYVGEKLEYDFVTKTGVVYGGKTFIDFWFIGGEVIKLKPNRHFSIKNATLTTSENNDPYWTIQAREMEVSDDYLLEASGATTVRFLDTPIFWLPPLPFKINLKSSDTSAASYIIAQDQGLWPLFGMRYKFYSWRNLTLSSSLNVRPTKGIGGSIESEYFTPSKRVEFLTRSYLDHDTFYRDSHPDRARTHYRLQGLYTAKNESGHSSLEAQYDYLSDKNLQTDFVTPGFKCETNKETKLAFYQRENWSIFSLKSQWQLNSFQTLKQELPASVWTLKPISLGISNIILENRFSASYLNYTFARTFTDLADFHSARFATHQTLYRPFGSSAVNFTPLVGFYGLFYTKDQTEQAALQAAFQYGFNFDLKLKKRYAKFNHTICPYLTYQGLTSPTLSPSKAYIFSIRDGFQKLNILRSGIRQLFYLSSYPLFEPNVILDLYSYAFFDSSTFSKTFPKIGVNLTWNFPSLSITSRFRWNSEVNVLDYANLGVSVTLNQYCALKSEFRHRSRFNWRKNSPDNFIMEATRPIDQLLNSPLSDRRNTLVSRLQIKLAPQWIGRIESHIGWGRKKDPGYNAIKIDLFTTISTSWQLHTTLIHSPAPKHRNTRFFVSLSLGAKPDLMEKLGKF